jgi:hypothetical protein
MLHPAVMISDFLESHAFPFVLQFCNRSFLCPLSQYPLQIPNRMPISLPSGPSIALPGIELVPNHTSSLNLEPNLSSSILSDVRKLQNFEKSRH